MKYSELSHEERELVLFIKNNETQYKKVTAAPEWKTIRDAARAYCREYANLPQKVFVLNNFYNVANYFKNLED